MESKKPLIIIPAYKEEANIEFVADNIINNYPQYDYIIVNDGSKDNTAKICRERNYNFCDLPINLGIGGAVQTGYKYAERNGYDIAVQIDGDGQHDVSQLEKVIAPIQSGEADVVIGSRFIAKAGFQSSKARRAGIKFLSGLIHICTGKKVFDVTSGYRAVNSRFIHIYAENYPNDYPEPEALVVAAINGGKVKEVPIIMNERKSGTSSIRAWKSVYYMIKVTLAIIICKISLGIRRQ